MASWLTKLKGKNLDNLNDLLVDQIKELYDVEDQLLDALPKMADAASSPRLKEAFRQHRDTTQRQKERLEQVFRQMGLQPEREKSEGIRGIIDDGQAVIRADGDPAVKDAALIAAAQQVEHYEMACYGSARAFARILNQPDVVRLLDQTLDEEKSTDERLTQVAMSGINQQAA
jgi:ferritin-like metal-binding protein YciE